METVNYKVGDIVELVDDVRYVYRGLNRKLRSYIYDPVLPNRLSEFFTIPEEECVKYGYNIGAVPFARKMDANVTKV
jgi:hypothetical protein